MAKQKYGIGQIVKYTGADLVTYEQGKTYTVLGYDEESDGYGILSETDEVYLLPEDALESLSEEEAKEIRISERMYEYYREKYIGVSSEDVEELDIEHLYRIVDISKDDIIHNRLKREADSFKNDAEYRFYLSNLYEEAYCIKFGIITLSMPYSEKCLYITEFNPENIIKGDETESYDWQSEDRVYKGSWPTFDNNLNNYLGKATYDGYGGYPASCCWLLDKASLLKLIDQFPDIINPFIRSKIDKDKYIVVWCYWD